MSKTMEFLIENEALKVLVTTKGVVVCEIEPRYVCIEPWHSVPDLSDTNFRWEDKPAAAVAPSGESWMTTLVTSFIR